MLWESLENLTQIAGIGRSGAEHTMSRGPGHLRAFPGDDVGAPKNSARRLGLAEPLDYVDVQAALSGWSR